MSVKKPAVDISDVNICELCYLAALIDGEGAVEINKRDLYPLIRVGMRSLLPYELCMHACIENSGFSIWFLISSPPFYLMLFPPKI